MNKEEIIKEFKDKFHPFIAYKVGGQSVDFSPEASIGIAEQLEHCEEEIIDWIANKIGDRNFLFKDTNDAYIQGRKDGENFIKTKFNLGN